MVEIDFTFMGKDFPEGLANWAPVQAALDEAVRPMEVAAKAELAAHRQEGHARIEVEKGDVDRYLVLNDERGLKAAMSIEYGRGPDENGKGAMSGLYILHHATGAASKATLPRSRRVKVWNKKFKRRRR